MSKKILIVDDSPTMIMSVRASLEMNGFKVETAQNGRKALDALKGGLKPDLIITDVNMPDMGGFELIKQARAMPSCRFTPILTLTTESDKTKREESRKLGATGWLVKPIPGPDLVNVVRQILPA
jgi:two-component system chemotaxis response regulator CheY